MKELTTVMRYLQMIVLVLQRRARLRQPLQRAHEGLGHPLRIFKYSKATDEVMKVARELTCTACERNKIVRPARKAAPPRERGVNEMVGIDMVWLADHKGHKRPALNCSEWSAHFQMVTVLPNKKPDTVREGYRHWVRLLRPPQTIALDQGREFEGSFALRAETDGSFIDVSSRTNEESRSAMGRCSS